MSEEDFFNRIINGLNNPIPSIEVIDGPCKEVILKDDDATLDALPVCIHTRLDAGAFITMGVQVAEHARYGRNASISRMQVFDGKTTGMLSVPPQQLGIYYREQEAAGEPLEVAVALGPDPYTLIATQYSGSIYVDEFVIAGGLKGSPVELVRCETINVAVPATSEIILEGIMPPGTRRREGPFGEYPGYYNPAAEHPIFELRAIAHRKDPIYLAGLTGKPTTNDHVLKLGVQSAMLYRNLREITPAVVDLELTESSAGTHAIIAVEPRYESEARDILMPALFSARIRPKMVTVVDADIDVRNLAAVEWARAFRMQAADDVIVIPRVKGVALDPSARPGNVGDVMGIDATKPLRARWEVTDVPGAERFDFGEERGQSL